VSAELRAIQAVLAEAFQRPDAMVEGDALQAKSAAVARGSARLKPSDQVEIYREQFWLRHLASLRDHYPGLLYVLGRDAFDALGRAYLVALPPQAISLRELGAKLAGFASQRSNLLGSRPALALDMMRYETAFIEVSDGPASLPLDPNKLATLPENAIERARVVLQPSGRLMTLTHPVHRIRLALSAGDAPTSADEPEAVRIALFRDATTLRFEELSPTAYHLLESLGAGEPLVAACNRMAETLDSHDAASLESDVGRWFSQWSTWGLIVDLVV
jgi:hypothetical protein